MYISIEEFLADWEHETESTRKLMNALTDASLAQQVAPGMRTLGRLAWHVAGAISEMMNRTGLEIDGSDDSAPVPASAAEIAEAYERASASLAREIRAQWTDESLATVHEMYGEMWPNHMTLAILLRHELHHRGQMTVLMRQAGLVVPGVCGPAYEEWAAYGMAAQN